MVPFAAMKSLDATGVEALHLLHKSVAVFLSMPIDDSH